MGAAECEQIRVDKFWGLDAQSESIARESMLMNFEDYFSKSHQQWLLTLHRQKQWEEEFKREQLQTSYNNAIKQLDCRKDYLRSLFSSDSTDVIIEYKWNSKDQSFLETVSKGNGGMLDENKEFSLLPMGLGSRSIAVHLDGLQQAKAITSESHLDSLGPSLRNRSIQDVVEESLRAPSILHASAVAPAAPLKSAQGQRAKAEASKKLLATMLKSSLPMEKSLLSMEELLKSLMTTGPKHNAALDGHVLHKWDTEALLKMIFNKLDEGKKGYLVVDDLVRIANNEGIQELMVFTVFGSWVKKKQWRKFLMLCENIDVATLHAVSTSRRSQRSQRASGRLSVLVL